MTSQDLSTLWRTLFDRIYVISLPESTDRRAYVERHLFSAGADFFEFHEACGPLDPEVERRFACGDVHRFPPCFRCGKTSCGRDDCNNVLIAPQVATFVTYLRLWEKIGRLPQRALVLEDDVALHPYWPKVLHELRSRIQSGSIRFEADTPKLLRLGWALGPDHDEATPFRIDSALRMSNPCHAMTSAFARLATTRFRRIDHTVDVYLHRDLPSGSEAATIFPPIASELSWSTGAFPSLIHPKAIHADFLARSGKLAAAEEQRAIAAMHARHVAHADPEES